MSMRIIDCEQLTEAWFTARAGAITASMYREVRQRVGGLSPQMEKMADAILNQGMDEEAAAEYAGYATPAKQAKAAMKNDKFCRALNGERVGELTAAAQNYAFLLACERLAGEPLAIEQFDSWATRRGRELEPEARAVHEMEHGVTVTPTGLVLTEDGHFGASADGLIDEDGGAEYKCFVAPDSMRPIMLDVDIDDHLDQVQGGMWITGRKWWHFAMYCPALEPVGKHLVVYEVHRDDDYIEKLEQDLLYFDRVVEQTKERILAAETMHVFGQKVRADQAAEEIQF